MRDGVSDLQMVEYTPYQENEEEETQRENWEKEITNKLKTIFLSEEDNKRLYAPWKYALIIKLISKENCSSISEDKSHTTFEAIWNFSPNWPGRRLLFVKFLQRGKYGPDTLQWTVVY